MAIVRAVKSGNWSDPTVWNTGALPTSADDVYSNTFTVTIDVSPTVLSISNAAATGVTAGGGFAISANGITLTCTATNGIIGPPQGTSVPVLTCSVTTNQTTTITSNVAASGAISPTINFTGAGTLNIVGNCTGGSNGGGGIANAVSNSSIGTINITGSVQGLGGNGQGVRNIGSGTINVTGNVTGGSGGLSYGITNESTGLLNITGSCLGGTQSALSASAVYTSTSGTINIVGSVTSSTTNPGVIVASSASVVTLTGPFFTSSSGVNPVYAARWFWQNTTPPATYYQIRSANLAVVRPLYTADSVGGNPATSNVRSGTVYGPAGELTGTCAVPPRWQRGAGCPG
jgi:hypothetical protein